MKTPQHVESPQMYMLMVAALARFESAAIFPAGKYTWVRCKSAATFTKGSKTYKVPKDAVIGVRPATSTKGMYRIVVESLGVNIVFSADQKTVDKLAGAAAKPGSAKPGSAPSTPKKEVEPPTVNNVRVPKLASATVAVVADPKKLFELLAGKYLARNKWTGDSYNDMIDSMMDRLDPISKWFNDNILYDSDWSGLVKLSTTLDACFKVKVSRGFVFRGLSLPNKFANGRDFKLTSKKPSSWALAQKTADVFSESTDPGKTGFLLATDAFKGTDIVYSSAHAAAYKKAMPAVRTLFAQAGVARGFSKREAENWAHMMVDNAKNYLDAAEQGEVILKPGTYATRNLRQLPYMD